MHTLEPKYVFAILLLFASVYPYRLQEIPRDERNEAFERYLSHTMENYTAWLSDKDPMPAIPLIIMLSNNQDNDRVNVTLEIKNQYMADHSKTLHEEISCKSFLNINKFVISRTILDDNPTPLLTLGGEYEIKRGEYKVSNSRSISISGTGTFLLKTRTAVESLTFDGYEISRFNYIDLSKAEMDWLYVVEWTEIVFENLNLDNDAIEGEYRVVREALGKIYSELLTKKSNGGYVPPLKLLLDYMEDVVTIKKFEDIISEWKSPPGGGHGNAIIGGLKLVIFVQILGYFMTINYD